MSIPQTHSGRVAVITGAGRGIGQALALGLAARGASAVAVDLHYPEETMTLLGEAGHTALGLVADVSDPAQTATVGDRIVREFGRIDILINNAGVFPFVDIDDLDYATWRRIMAVNLDSQFLMVKSVLPAMKAGGWGRIVNLTSNSIVTNAPGLSHYMASKMGNIGFTRGLANDLAPFGITVNAVGPTLTITPGVREVHPPEALIAVAQAQAIKRNGQPEDLVGAVAFLSSDDAAFVTGQTLMADGGYAR